MYIIQYTISSPYRDSFSGERTAIFEDREAAESFIDAAQEGCLDYRFIEDEEPEPLSHNGIVEHVEAHLDLENGLVELYVGGGYEDPAFLVLDRNSHDLDAGEIDKRLSKFFIKNKISCQCFWDRSVFKGMEICNTIIGWTNDMPGASRSNTINQLVIDLANAGLGKYICGGTHK